LGDGIGDLIIGWPALPSETYIVFGRTTAFPALIQLRSLYPDQGGGGSVGSCPRGSDERLVRGLSVDGAGDVNGDGTADVFIGTRPGGFCCETYVVFGRTGAFPAAFELRGLNPANGGDASERFLQSGNSIEALSGAGDVSGDGIDDLIMGDPSPSPRVISQPGRATLCSDGQTGSPRAFRSRGSVPTRAATAVPVSS
jgi:glycosylphosphatidylinositol phospholipase D